jgi:hypothetical protein
VVGVFAVRTRARAGWGGREHVGDALLLSQGVDTELGKIRASR